MALLPVSQSRLDGASQKEDAMKDDKERLLQAVPTPLTVSFEEQVTEQHTILFQGDTLAVVFTNYRAFYVSIPSVCAALGLNVKGQIQRMKRTPLLTDGLHFLSLETRGGVQRVYCLHIEWIDYWLGSIRLKGLQVPATKIEVYRRELPAAVYDVFHRVGSLKGQPWLSNYLQQTPAPFELVEPPGEDPLLEQKLTMLTNIPPPNLTEQFTVTASQVDRSMREATLAREDLWEADDSTRIFSASNNLQIYLGTPQSPLDLSEAQEKIRQLGGSTVLTARVVMGLWNLRRNDSRLAINGSAAIHIDEIFAWRGLQKHQRSAYPGASRQRTDGYRTEQKHQVLRDLSLLASCCVRGHCTVNIKGRRKTFYINGPYLRYSVVTTPTIWGEEEIVGFFLSPGDWIATYEAHDRDYLVEIDRRIFLLNPQNEQHELRLALYLIELWRQLAKQGSYGQPITMIELLTASMIPVDKVNVTRFVARIENALEELWKRGILGARPEPILPIDKNKTRWGNEWLNSQWILVPPFEITEHMTTRQAKQLPPPQSHVKGRRTRMS
jgi:hypothetical protein